MSRVLFILVLCVACGPESTLAAPEHELGSSTVDVQHEPPGTTVREPTTTSSSSDGSSETTAAGCPGGSTDDCCCFVAPEDTGETWGGLYVDNLCAWEQLCPIPYLSCPKTAEISNDGCSAEEIEVDESDVGAIDCMLDALAAGTTGRVLFSVSMDEGWASRTHTIDIVAAGDAFHTALLEVDLSADHEGVQRWELRPAAAFEACRDTQIVADKVACLLDPAAAVVETCLDPGEST